MLVIIVGGIPIAMPTVLSVTLALGAYKLAKEGAIVARMSAVEEMAGMDILCSDKTGALLPDLPQLSLHCMWESRARNAQATPPLSVYRLQLAHYICAQHERWQAQSGLRGVACLRFIRALSL